MHKLKLFDSVLFVGPNYKSRKGGVSSVLRTYSDNIENFNFYPSVFFTNVIINTILFPINIFGFLITLTFNNNIEIVHIHGASRGSFYRKYIFFLICKLFRKKVVYHIHGGKFHVFYSSSHGFIKKRIRQFINKSDALAVLSEEWKAYYLANFEQNQIFIVNNIVDFVKTKMNCITMEKVYMLFLGKLGPNKGIFDLLQVILENKEYFQENVKLTIGGDGEAEKLQNIIADHNLNDIVEYVGWVNGQDKQELLSKANIMILPSYNEGLPISLLEAMSYSMPIISTKVGGIPQILKDGLNGKFVEPGNKEQIFQAIKFYVENKSYILEHGQNSYQLVRDFFPEKVISTLQDIYQNI